MGGKRAADAANRRKPAFIDNATPTGDVDQRPDNGFGKTAAGHLGLELADPARQRLAACSAPPCAAAEEAVSMPSAARSAGVA